MAHDELVCPRCGNLRSECSDPTIDWHPHESVCWASATRDWGMRVLRDKHETKKPGAAALHPLDGVTVFVSQQEPEGDDPFAGPTSTALDATQS
jgi:hypothetical protein